MGGLPTSPRFPSEQPAAFGFKPSTLVSESILDFPTSVFFILLLEIYEMLLVFSFVFFGTVFLIILVRILLITSDNLNQSKLAGAKSEICGPL